MTTTDTTVSNLIINTMTQAQYNQITPNNNELYLVTDSTITSSEVTSALGYTPTNTSLSNLSSTSCTNFDGQWVSSILLLTTSTTFGTFPINLGTTGTNPRNYLPNDNYSYEVLVTFTLQHNGGTGGGNNIVVGNESAYTAHTDKSGDTSNNTRIIVVNSSHSFDYTLSGKNVSTLNIEVVAYRRLGTNT